MSDRVAVMNNGRVEQAGPPQIVYEEPATLFVADFLGVSNLISAQASADGNGCLLQVGERKLRAEQGAVDARGEVRAMIRPERIEVEPQGARRSDRLPGHARARRVPRQLPRAARPSRRRRPRQGGRPRTTARRCRTSRDPRSRCTCRRKPCACWRPDRFSRRRVRARPADPSRSRPVRPEADVSVRPDEEDGGPGPPYAAVNAPSVSRIVGVSRVRRLHRRAGDGVGGQPPVSPLTRRVDQLVDLAGLPPATSKVWSATPQQVEQPERKGDALPGQPAGIRRPLAR